MEMFLLMELKKMHKNYLAFDWGIRSLVELIRFSKKRQRTIFFIDLSENYLAFDWGIRSLVELICSSKKRRQTLFFVDLSEITTCTKNSSQTYRVLRWKRWYLIVF